jgi:chitin disaccharide deacetylase
VVTADDFGLDASVNEAVERAHRHGILTAASLMVAGPAAADACARARRLPALRVGLHLTLCDGPAVLPPEEIPDLVDRRGRLRADLPALGWAIAIRPAARRQMRAEVRAQFEAYRATGLPLDHVNGHRHFHLHPMIADAIIAIGPEYGVRAMRIPAEPARVLRAVDPKTATAPARCLAPLAKVLRRKAQRAALRLPDAVFGLTWSGAMTAARLAGLLGRLPEGLVEIYLHPATSDAFPGHAAGYRYAEELAALVDRRCLEALATSRHAPGGYTDDATQPERAVFAGSPKADEAIVI